MVLGNIKLKNGVSIPEIGLGTSGIYEKGVLAVNIKTALQMGYRHIDCAKGHENQREIGKALQEASVPRKQLFITSRIPEDMLQPELVPCAVKEILNELQLDYLDLLLVNWPSSTGSGLKNDVYGAKCYGPVPIMDTWKAMEALVDSGKVRAIGVSNFSRAVLEMMIPQCRIVPTANQIEVHPHNPEHNLVNYCQLKGITIIAHSPLGGGSVRVMDDDLIQSIAKSHNCTPAQVIISWLWVRGIAVIPRSNNESRLKQNLSTVSLTLDEMQMIGRIQKRERRLDSGNNIEELTQIFYGNASKCPVV
ncbi:hypothetical protein H4R20_003936 [Coemansia guatemalensis]|uniref:NADP-dependent oxidoreductase domain-containing protein n=1 Tax=Coemansia guatemalensis TaxID=2761395 RepID=A0A9W8HUA4_9FUNG|nr:hypothetical protein H4R20_003936 [Coemansia guatemalensis]